MERTGAEDRELAILQWSAEFTGPDAVRHAEEMATPWFGINQDCYDAIWAELRQTWPESALIPACRALDIPVLIIDGAGDLRPRWAVDSLEHACPMSPATPCPLVTFPGLRSPPSSANCCGITCTGINVDRYSPREGASDPR